MRRFLLFLAVALAVVLALFWATDARASEEETVRRTAAEEGIDPDLAAAVARCESGFRSSAKNGQYEGVFQMSPGWGSSQQRADAEWSTRQFAAAVKAGSASRRWRACWPGRRTRATRSSPAASSLRRPAPTGTDHCDRASGVWRCHPSWTLPDALAVSPTIEADPGAHVERCYWRGEPLAWTCDVRHVAQSAPAFVAAEAVSPPAEAERGGASLRGLALLFSLVVGGGAWALLRRRPSA